MSWFEGLCRRARGDSIWDSWWRVWEFEVYPFKGKVKCSSVLFLRVSKLTVVDCGGDELAKSVLEKEKCDFRKPMGNV